MFFFVKGNQKVINVFYLLLKMRVKVVNVNMKSDTLKMVFLTISLDFIVMFDIIKFIGKISCLLFSLYHYSYLPSLKGHFQK